jgi:penicillin-binding protein 1A
MGCTADHWAHQAEPELIDDRRQILDPHTAYQMTSILEGVVQRGTGKVLRSLNRPVAGKTGTTNEEKDAWFLGYTPNLVVGVYIGYDTPKPMGRGGTGGMIAAPVVGEFLKDALDKTPPEPFRVPPGIKFVRIDLKTGLRATADDPNTIIEAFKPNEDPDDGTSMIGFANATADASGAGAGMPPPNQDAYSRSAPPPPPQQRMDGGLAPNGLW